jgi:hypothetical protein
MTTLTVVAADNVIVVDGEALSLNFAFPSNLWAIQWDGTTGHAEWTDGPNTEATLEFAQPYIDAWQSVKDAQPSPVEPTAQEILNSESQAYLDSTDKFFTRFSETGKAMPEGMSEARAAARESIVGEVS